MTPRALPAAPLLVCAAAKATPLWCGRSIQMAETPATEITRPWWTAYFCLMCLAWALGLVFGNHSPVDILNSVLFGLGLVGLWSYLDARRIGWRPFWIAYFVVSLAGVAYGLAMLLIDKNTLFWP